MWKKLKNRVSFTYSYFSMIINKHSDPVFTKSTLYPDRNSQEAVVSATSFRIRETALFRMIAANSSARALANIPDALQTRASCNYILNVLLNRTRRSLELFSKNMIIQIFLKFIVYIYALQKFSGNANHV